MRDRIRHVETDYTNKCKGHRSHGGQRTYGSNPFIVQSPTSYLYYMCCHTYNVYTILNSSDVLIDCDILFTKKSHIPHLNSEKPIRPSLTQRS